MTRTPLQLLIDDIVSLVDEKKSEQICLYDVSGKSWLTDYILVVGVKNTIHSKAVVQDLKQFFLGLPSSDDVYDTINITGTSESGWVILDANSIVIHCINTNEREHYDIDSHFSLQGDVYYY